LHTGAFADAVSEAETRAEYARIVTSAEYAANIGLRVHGGHGLNYHNVIPVAAIPVMRELNIGHAIVARSVFSGIARAVGDMKQLMVSARRS
jgi:pyridoxine 5-phosphate synthase